MERLVEFLTRTVLLKPIYRYTKILLRCRRLKMECGTKFSYRNYICTQICKRKYEYRVLTAFQQINQFKLIIFPKAYILKYLSLNQNFIKDKNNTKYNFYHSRKCVYRNNKGVGQREYQRKYSGPQFHF